MMRERVPGVPPLHPRRARLLNPRSFQIWAVQSKHRTSNAGEHEHGSWKHEAPTRAQGIARIAKRVFCIPKTAGKQQLEVKYNPTNLQSPISVRE